MPTTHSHSAPRHSRKTWIITGLSVLAIAAIAAGAIYWYTNSQYVYVDTSSINAPEILLSPFSPGILEAVYVNEGDTVTVNQTVARVGNELIKSKVAGIIVSVPETIGAQINPGQAVVTMIDPTQLRVVGEVDENKGLDRIKVGDAVTFTVDAFGGKQYSGVVDEIAPTANSAGVVFNISNERQVQQFDVKARFDTNAYPELKNGMSARMWIYTQ
jgi:multidrug resistance efflux pump